MNFTLKIFIGKFQVNTVPGSFVARCKSGIASDFSGLALDSHSATRISDEKFRLSSGLNEVSMFCYTSQVHGDAFVSLSRSTLVWLGKVSRRFPIHDALLETSFFWVS